MAQPKLKIVQCFNAYLEMTENWCYRMIRNIPDVDLVVVSKRLVNLNAFPLPSAEFLTGPSPRFRPGITAAKELCHAVLRRMHGPFWRSFLVRRTQDAALIHAHFAPVGWDCLWLADKIRRPLIISFYGYDYEWLPKNKPEWIARYHRLFTRATLFIVEGRCGVEKLVALGCPQEKIRIVRLGVEVEKIPYMPRTKDVGELRLVQVATFSEKKGYATTVRAFAHALSRCPNMHLTLVGRDTCGLRPRIESLISSLGIGGRVGIIDGIDFSKLHTFLQQFHVFIHPSCYSGSGDSEGGAPIVLLDAQATGMPVLSTTHCDIPEEVCQGVSGFLVPERDELALSKEISRCYAMNDLEFGELCLNARKHVEKNYDAVHCAQLLRKHYVEAVASLTV